MVNIVDGQVDRVTNENFMVFDGDGPHFSSVVIEDRVDEYGGKKDIEKYYEEVRKVHGGPFQHPPSNQMPDGTGIWNIAGGSAYLGIRGPADHVRMRSLQRTFKDMYEHECKTLQAIEVHRYTFTDELPCDMCQKSFLIQDYAQHAKDCSVVNDRWPEVVLAKYILCKHCNEGQTVGCIGSHWLACPGLSSEVRSCLCLVNIKKQK